MTPEQYAQVLQREIETAHKALDTLKIPRMDTILACRRERWTLAQRIDCLGQMYRDMQQVIEHHERRYRERDTVPQSERLLTEALARMIGKETGN